MLFQYAHVPNAVCQPSRQSMMTGLHPHRNGSLGFVPVPKGVPNLSELLLERGYTQPHSTKAGTIGRLSGANFWKVTAHVGMGGPG